MTPGARVAAAIEVLDAWIGGEPAEQALTNWARRSRFAGSKDRAAIRGHVYDALRRKRSFAALGGSETGRGLMLGKLRAEGMDPTEIFNGQGYAPSPLSNAEARSFSPEGNAALDCPDWLAPHLERSLGTAFEPVMQALQERAPVFLRVNLARGNLVAAQDALSAEGIETRSHALSPTALEVVSGERRISGSAAFRNGIVELQDAASQAVVDHLGLTAGMRVLDYCAGGGGKALAMAAQGAHVSAHDISARRMADIPARAARAGVKIRTLDKSHLNGMQFDLVLADAPCSGSGSWRRNPQGKWALTAQRLDEILHVQSSILEKICQFVKPGGKMAYATCSMIDMENEQRIDAFLDAHPGWRLETRRHFLPTSGGDGFFVALLCRD